MGFNAGDEASEGPGLRGSAILCLCSLPLDPASRTANTGVSRRAGNYPRTSHCPYLRYLYSVRYLISAASLTFGRHHPPGSIQFSTQSRCKYSTAQLR